MASDTQTLEIIIRLRDLATRSLSRLRRGFGGIRSTIGALSGAVFSLQGALLGLGGGLVIRSFLGVATSFEKMEKQLDQLTKGKGTETLQEINEWAKQMPVNTEQAVGAFVQMQAFGLDPTLDKMEILVDVATVMGQDALPRVSRALGQMAALGKISAEELNQMSELGINARGILSEAYGVPLEELQKQQVPIKDVIDTIWEGLAGQFGGASIRALESWEGIMTVLKSYYTDFLKTISDSGVFEYMKLALTEVLDIVKQFEEDGSIKSWAETISNYGIKTIRKLAQAVAIVGDVFRGWKIIWQGLRGAYAVFAIGVNQATLSILDGIKAVLDYFAPAIEKIANGLEKVAFTDHSKKVVAGMRAAANAMNGVGDEYRKGLVERIAKEDEVLLNAGKNIEAIATQETYLQRVNKVLGEIDKKYKEQAKDKKKEEKKTTITKKTFAVTGVGEAQSQLKKVQADTARALVEVESLFKSGTLSAEQYYNAQVVGATQAYQAELNLLQKKYDSEKDKTKKQKIHDEIYALEQKHQTALFQLNEQRIQNIKDAEDKAREEQKQLKDLERRELVVNSSESEITSVFTLETADLDNRHAEEIQKLRDMKAEEALINETFRVQELEKDKLAADQKIRLNKMILDATSQVLGDTASAFEDLYNATGKKTKEFFYVYKTAAVAQAVIDTYKGATSAYSALAGIPYVGPALGIAAATAAIAAGFARVATIKAQSLAEGGQVLGSSPHSTADNIPINATAGEFMQPVSAVSYYGKNLMEAIRTKAIPRELLMGFKMPSFKTGLGRFASGGAVSSSSGAKGTAGSDESPVTINNIVDPQMMDQHLVSTPGQRTVMNVISENKYQLKQLVLGE